MASGVVKWFNATKGYGFIAPADGGKDVFVHISAVERAGQKSLQEGQQIQYELVEGRNGRFRKSRVWPPVFRCCLQGISVDYDGAEPNFKHGRIA